MGERGTVEIFQKRVENPLYFYFHWNGPTLNRMLADALEVARPRWHDSSYGTRILANELFAHLKGEETGGGISLTPYLSEYAPLKVRFAEQTVTEDKAVYSFEEFVSMEHPEREPGWF